MIIENIVIKRSYIQNLFEGCRTIENSLCRTLLSFQKMPKKTKIEFETACSSLAVPLRY